MIVVMEVIQILKYQNEALICLFRSTLQLLYQLVMIAIAVLTHICEKGRNDCFAIFNSKLDTKKW